MTSATMNKTTKTTRQEPEAKKVEKTKTKSPIGRGSAKFMTNLRVGIPLALELAVIRVVAALGIMVLLLVTVFGPIPELGAYMNSQAAVSLGTNASLSAIIGIWVVPFVFMVGMLFALELWLIRKLWAFSTRMVVKAKARVQKNQAASVETRPTVGNKKKRKK